MQITIDLSDKYVEGKLEEQLESRLIREVNKKIWEKFKDHVDDLAEKIITAHVEEALDDEIRKHIRIYIKSEKIDYKGDMITLETWILKQFRHKSGSWNRLDEEVMKRGTKFAEKLKDRYDMHFATQVIAKMRDQDMLKEGVETALFGNKENGDNDE